jgi:hypothetical protein
MSLQILILILDRSQPAPAPAAAATVAGRPLKHGVQIHPPAIAGVPSRHDAARFALQVNRRSRKLSVATSLGP